MKKRAFGELEAEILDIMRTGDKKTVKDVHQVLGGEDNYNTIMTVMMRLATKDLLERERVGLQYEYWIKRAEKSPTLLHKIKQKLFGIKPSILVSHLVDTAEELTDEDIEAMEELLKKVKK